MPSMGLPEGNLLRIDTVSKNKLNITKSMKFDIQSEN